MTTGAELPSVSGSSKRALRIWLGLLLGVLFVFQIFSAGCEYQKSHDWAFSPNWLHFDIALACAILAVMTVIGMAGLILGKAWAWRVIMAGAALQIFVTIVALILDLVVIFERYSDSPEPAYLSDIIAIVVYITISIGIPVGVLVLAVVGRPRSTSPRHRTIDLSRTWARRDDKN